MQIFSLTRKPWLRPPLVNAILCSTLIFLLGGCGTDTFLSQSGPSRSALVGQAQLRVQTEGLAQQLQYALIPLGQATIGLLADDELAANFPSKPTELPPAAGLIGIGDQISITIFESGSGGLFLPREGGTRAGNFVTIPTQQVGNDGNIEMPYAGTLHVAGSTPHAVSNIIQARLANRALEPQAVVAVVERRAGQISVLGEVSNGTHFPLDPGGARIVEAIARAGGPRFPAYDSMVTLQRHGQVYHALLSEIAQNGQQNVELQSGDVVYVAHEPRYFVAMGALGQAAALSTPSLRLPFEDSHISLADALAKTGGLLDERANATGVFVYRSEPRAKLQALGVSAPGDMPAMVPTVYLVNLRDPAGLFYARKFAVHNEDVLFASNAPATDVGKYLSLIGPLTGSSAKARATSR
jgi:polysaccharide export outer membrane protein